MHTGEATESADMDPEQWSNLVSGTNELGRVICTRSSASSWCSTRTPTPTSTPRTGSCSSCKDTDPQFVNLCLDTGHIAYCDGDNLQIIEQRPGADHLRAPEVGRPGGPGTGAAARSCRWPRRCRWASWSSRPTANPQVPPLLDALAGLDRDIFAVIEQDLYPIAPHIPLAIQASAAGLLHRLRPRPDPPLAVLTAASHGVAHNPLSGRLFT